MCWIAPVSVNLSTSYIRYQLPLEPPVYSSNRSVRMVEVKLKGLLDVDVVVIGVLRKMRNRVRNRVSEQLGGTGLINFVRCLWLSKATG